MKDNLKMIKTFIDEDEIGEIIDLKNKNLAIVVKNEIRIFDYTLFKSTHKIDENKEIIKIIFSENTNLIIFSTITKIKLYDIEKKNH